MDQDCVDAAAISYTQNSEAIKREMESVDNRKLFKEINVSTIPSSSLLRKVSLDIGRGKAVEIVDVLMGDLPFFLFQSKSNKKITWFCCSGLRMMKFVEFWKKFKLYPTTNFRSILRSKV